MLKGGCDCAKDSADDEEEDHDATHKGWRYSIVTRIGETKSERG